MPKVSDITEPGLKFRCPNSTFPPFHDTHLPDLKWGDLSLPEGKQK